MPLFVKEKVYRALNEVKKSLKGANVLIIGVAYKNDIDDPRESPAEKVIELLMQDGVNVSYNDPYIPEYKVKDMTLKSEELTPELWNKIDCAVVISNHSCYDFNDIVKSAKVLVDTRNATKKVTENRDKIVLL